MKENIYQYARSLKKGMTQERAAELLNVDVTTLRKYETDKGTPSIETVESMQIIYDVNWLRYKHFELLDQNKILPALKITKSLEGATMIFWRELDDVNEKLRHFMKISSDGVIDEHEIKDSKDFLREVEELIAAMINLKYAIEDGIKEAEKENR